MANKKKKISPLVKAKRRYRRNKSRLDMRKGGRVGLMNGGDMGIDIGGDPNIDDEELKKLGDRLTQPTMPSADKGNLSRTQQQYAYDPYASQSIDKTRRTWTPVTQQTQWNLPPSLQTFDYEQAVASGMPPTVGATDNRATMPTMPSATIGRPEEGSAAGAQAQGAAIGNVQPKDAQGNNLIYNSVKKIWEVAKDVVNPFDGSYPIAKLVKQTGETLIPGGANPLADWFTKQALETTGTAAGAPVVNTPVVNTPVVNTPVANQPIPPLTQAQQQAQDLAIQQQIAADQAAIQQAGLTSQAGLTTTGKTAEDFEDVTHPGDEETDDADTGPPEGWWTPYGYTSEAEAILSGDFIWDAETKSFVLKGGGTGGGNGNGNGGGDGTYPAKLPEGGQFAYDVAREERKIAPPAVKVGGYLTNEDGSNVLDAEGNPIPLTPDMKETAVDLYKRDAEGELITDDEGNPIPISATATTAEVDLYKKDAQGNILRDDKGAPIPVTPTATADKAAIAKGFLGTGYSFTPPIAPHPDAPFWTQQDFITALQKGSPNSWKNLTGGPNPSITQGADGQWVINDDLKEWLNKRNTSQLEGPPEGKRWAYGPEGNRIEVPIGTKAGVEGKKIAQDSLEKILTSPTVTAAQSTFTDDHKAIIDEIIGVTKATGVTIDDEEAAKGIAEDLQGELSDGAKSIAISISGANLSRVLRAKKQLRKAGLEDPIILALGDNPDDLEDRLDEFTEAERGVVAGLPEEALVSNQLDTLLTGIDNGEVPTWAQPAVAAVNQMMAARGLDASTVGRDNLFNAIIQSAVPLAQQNAQAIQATFTQTRELESRATIAQAQINQQTALDHANKIFQMDMANFNEDQTRNLANSKWLQTVELTNASMEQQAAVQEAANLANLDLATLSTRERLAVNNAKSFLQLDMSNLTNRQQSEVLTDQMEMQKLLSNQSAENARLQFNAQSENQVNTFMANLANQVELNNAQRIDATKQFNATQKNAAIARREGIEADVSKLNAQLVTQVDQFNAQQDFERNKWNATNQAMVEQSNVEWRRRANTINTAAQNQINMQNAMNTFKISGASLSNYWQQLRDEAAYDFKSVENAENRLAQILSTAIANEGDIAKKDYWDTHVAEFKSIYDTWFG